MGSSSGLVLLAGFFFVALGVFVSVLCLVGLVKVLQIAEDLRYLRSKSDIHVSRPKGHMRLVVACVAVSVGLSVLAVSFLASVVAASGYLPVR